LALLALLIVPDPRALPLLLVSFLFPIAEKNFCKQAFASKLLQAICSGKLRLTKQKLSFRNDKQYTYIQIMPYGPFTRPL
jgi:hypothetical protein